MKNVDNIPISIVAEDSSSIYIMYITLNESDLDIWKLRE
jgi:hypothetical protein